MKCHGWRLGSCSVFLSFFLLLSACGRGQSGWQAFPVPVYVDVGLMSNPDDRADFEDGMRFWEEKAGKKLFDVQGEWTGGGLPYQGAAQNPDSIVENVVFVHYQWPFASGYVGMTVVKPFDSGQRALVMINPNTNFCHGDCNYNFTETSMRKTFAHELGHFIGLQHSQSKGDIMYPTSLPGGSLNQLSFDESALRTLTKSSEN